MEEQTKHLKLHGSENYAVWRFQLKILLNSDGHYDTIMKEKPTEETGLTAWMKADLNAQKMIVTSVTEKVMSNLLGCSNSKEMLNKLEALYGLKPDSSVSVLQQKFHSCLYDNRDTMAEHITKLETIAYQLKSLKEEISEQMLISKILSTLPKEYAHFHSAWDSAPMSERTLTNLTSRLLLEESRLKNREESVALKTVNVEKPNMNSRLCFQCGKYGHLKKNCFSQNKSSSVGENRPKCYNCGKLGHVKKYCRLPKSGDKNNSVGSSSRERDEHSSAVKTKALCAITSNSIISEALVSVGEDENGWFLDSAASDHMSPRRNYFRNYKTVETIRYVKLGDNSLLKVVGIGDVYIRCVVNGETNINFLEGVLHVPDLSYDLFSANKTTDKGYELGANSKMCWFSKNNERVIEGDKIGSLWTMRFEVIEESRKLISENSYAMKTESLQTWHKRLVHQNVKHVKSVLVKNNIPFKDEEFFCDDCQYGKIHRLPFPATNTKTTAPGEIIHSDICGPMEVESLGGSRYMLLFKDDFSHYRTVFFLKFKSDVQSVLENFIRSVKTDTGNKVKVLRTDRGREDLNKHVKEILQKFGIRHQLTTGYAPEQNGSAEREMRTLVEAARTMLCSKSLSKTLWAEAINTSVYVINRTGTSSISGGGKCPFELWFGKKPDITKFQIFGDEVFCHIPKQKRRKLDPKAKKGIFVGYDENVKGYKILEQPGNQIRMYHDVVFKPAGSNDFPLYVECNPTENGEVEAIPENNEKNEEYRNNENSEPEEPTKMNLRDRSTLKKPVRYQIPVAMLAIEEPESYAESLSSKDAENWNKAMKEELKSLEEYGTYYLCDLPTGKKALPNKWVYRIKMSTEGKIDKYKARLVIKGCSQQEGIDYSETFSPVAKFESIRMIVSMSPNYEMQQFDVPSAFLHAELTEEVYMKQPEGFEDGSNRVCRLKRSLYGLKQAPRAWNHRFMNFMKKFNLNVSEADPCILYDDDRDIILSIFVDDGLIASRNKTKRDKILEALKSEFKIKLEPLMRYLGVEIQQDNDKVFISQTAYTNKIIQKFGMENSNEMATPYDPNTDLNASESLETVGAPYREAVGSLLFLAKTTRPDIMYAVSKVSQFMESPKTNHWTAVKRILRYLKGTKEFGITYSKTGGNLIGYSDSDFAGDTGSRKSTTGFVFLNGNGAISWCSRKQQTISLSTTEAEYIAASEAAREATWLTVLKRELMPEFQGAITLCVDNQSAIKIMKNPELHRRTKHIDVKYHFIRSKVQDGMIEIKYVPTADQLADIFTKGLTKEKFQYLRTQIGVTRKI